ncbi:Thioredoxin superfamily protein [Melia azedarach]|uniref:Thioredoxin superfamily protein n=1 Tax=Melia azedarach TaxID=155640 RepID=A0ACC1WRH7_MELAZ|nr:Thioredoxin superfamily protein [Melia azedarach]
MVTRATVACSAGARALGVPRALAATRRIPLSFVSTTRSFWKMGFNPLQLRSTAPHERKSLIIRAARTESKGVSLGFRAPHFELPEPLTGKVWKLEDFESYPALLVMFICNHCPFVKHLKKDFVKLANFYSKKGLAVVAISSNSVATHPQDGPEFMAEEAKLFKYPFPYLYDESQDVARDFGAVCTPEFFLYKKDGRRPFELVYHGQFDDSRPRNGLPVTGRDIILAIECVLSGQPVPSNQKPSIGCSIKWHPQMEQ